MTFVCIRAEMSVLYDKWWGISSTIEIVYYKPLRTEPCVQCNLLHPHDTRSNKLASSVCIVGSRLVFPLVVWQSLSVNVCAHPTYFVITWNDNSIIKLPAILLRCIITLFNLLHKSFVVRYKFWRLIILKLMLQLSKSCCY